MEAAWLSRLPETWRSSLSACAAPVRYAPGLYVRADLALPAAAQSGGKYQVPDPRIPHPNAAAPPLHAERRLSPFQAEPAAAVKAPRGSRDKTRQVAHRGLEEHLLLEHPGCGNGEPFAVEVEAVEPEQIGPDHDPHRSRERPPPQAAFRQGRLNEPENAAVRRARQVGVEVHVDPAVPIGAQIRRVEVPAGHA